MCGQKSIVEMGEGLKQAVIGMYADDSTLYYAAKTVSELDNVLSAELNKVFDWIKQNKLVLNISKTKSIVLGSSHKLSSTPKISLNLSREPIEQVDGLLCTSMVLFM